LENTFISLRKNFLLISLHFIFEPLKKLVSIFRSALIQSQSLQHQPLSYYVLIYMPTLLMNGERGIL